MLLTSAMRLGEVAIVTNASGTWVQESAHRFMPRLASTLSRLKVWSARSLYEHRWPGDFSAWKLQTFRDVFQHHALAYNKPRGALVNLVVLGDSNAEIEAAQTATKGLWEQAAIKTVKFKAAPSVSDLLGEVRHIAQELGKVVREEKSINFSLVPLNLRPNQEHLRSLPCGWELAEPSEPFGAFYSHYMEPLFGGA